MGVSLYESRGPGWEPGTDVAEDLLFDLLENPRARTLLTVVGEAPMTVNEIAARTDIPVSTIYRQLGELADAGLVEKSIRLDPNGQHSTQYARRVSDISISIADGFAVQVA